VTELRASTGRLVRTLQGRPRFNDPSGIAVAAGQVWVANTRGGPGGADGSGSVTELAARSGRWERTLSSGRFGFHAPAAITAEGGRVWIANNGAGIGGDSVTELTARTGGLAADFTDSSYGFGTPAAIVADGAHVWVANGSPGAGSVTEMASGGRWERTFSAASYDLSDPAALAVDASQLWIASLEPTGGSIRELPVS
jgi:DNA-binding beta-propeller fold protein YncE